MISPVGFSRVFVVEHRVDFRLGHQGLLGVAHSLGLDPLKGDLIVFIGRAKTRIKILYADSTGLWVSTKQFTNECMKTVFSFLSNPGCKEISQGELALLIEGSSYLIKKKIIPNVFCF
jgi:hypothetical protein